MDDKNGIVIDMDFVESYNNRYKSGYMESWPKAKKDRVKNYIKSLHLPSQGRALDFGCGKGDFTVVLKEALPSWEVYGSDISEVGLEMARMRIHNCTFLAMEKIKQERLKFDLLFSHHVMEHVPVLSQVFNDFEKIADEKGYMIHILPSRCENTFEHWVAKSANDGIDADLGNRYYYEHPGHLRRLSAEEFGTYCIDYGFIMKKKVFSNKIFGTLNWISRTNLTFIRNMFNTKRTNQTIYKFLFLILQLFFITSSLLRTPSIQLPKAFSKRKKSKRKYLLFLLFLCMYPGSFIFDKIISFFAEAEWRLYREAGSEMYLFFKRTI